MAGKVIAAVTTALRAAGATRHLIASRPRPVRAVSGKPLAASGPLARSGPVLQQATQPAGLRPNRG